MNDLLLRALIAVGLIALGYGVYRLFNASVLNHGREAGMGLEDLIPGRPGILYFTMDGCLPCKTTQRPALKQLSGQLGDRIQVIEVDVVAHPEVAESWHVVSVPTTIILDRVGEPRHINHGVTLSGTLHSQLERFGGLISAATD